MALQIFAKWSFVALLPKYIYLISTNLKPFIKAFILQREFFVFFYLKSQLLPDYYFCLLYTNPFNPFKKENAENLAIYF